VPVGIAAAAVTAAIVPAGVVSAAGLGSIRVTAERLVVKADGRSTTILSAEVRDDRGQVVPDGTRLTFATTAGRLDTPVQTTRSGVARVVLTAADLPGTALVTVNLETPGQAAPAQTVITFTVDGDADDVNAAWARVEGKDYVGYAADKGIIQAVGRGGRARIAYRGVTVEGDTLQLAANDLIVRANGRVTLTSAGEKRTYENLRFDLRQMEGVAERLDDGRSVVFEVKGPRLDERRVIPLPPAGVPAAPAPEEGGEKPGTTTEPVPATPAALPPAPEPVGPQPQQPSPETFGPQPQFDAPEPPAPEAPAPPPVPAGEPMPAAGQAGQPEAPQGEDAPPMAVVDPASWQMVDISDSSVTVVARSIAIKPNETIQFRRATFYIDGQRTVSLPFHVMQLGQSSLFREQVVGLGPQGVTVDFPLYYDVRPGGIGTLHVRRGARYGTSAYSTRPGWSLDAEQAYNGKGGTEGVFAVTGVTRQDWGARLNHAQRFGGDGATRGNFYVDFPAHRDLFGTAQLSRHVDALRGMTLNLAASGSRSAGYRDELTDTVSGRGGDLRGQLYADTDPHSLFGTPRLQFSFNAGTARQLYYGANASTASAVSTHSANLRLYTMPLPVSRATTLRQSLTLGQTWVDGRLRESASPNAASIALRDGASVLGTTALNHSLGKLGAVGLTYDYQQTPFLSGFAGVGSGRHRLGMTAFLSGGQAWRLNATATKSLDRPTESLFADLNVSLGGPWSAGILTSATRFQSARYNDVQFRLARNIAGREVAVYYSTLSRRFQFDLAGARF
jgi:hypothetical protein